MRISAFVQTHARPLAAALAVLILALGAAPAVRAQEPDPAIPTIDAFDKSLLETMKAADDLGVKDRYTKLEPAIEKAFNLPVMARYAVGEKWPSFSDAEHQSLIDAFTRLTVASYVERIDGYSGKTPDQPHRPQTRNLDEIVQTKLIRPNRSLAALNYRMRLDGGTWKVIDIYTENVSQLYIWRREVADKSMGVGAKALVKYMNAQADELMKGGRE